MGQYVTLAQVKQRVLGKVKFTTDETDENAMQESLAETILEEAEAEIEMRLSVRYSVPFVTEDDGAFAALPQTTQRQIQAIVFSECMKRILMTDFGRGSAASGEEYLEQVIKDAESRVARIIEIRDGQFNHFRYPPLPGLKLADHNSAADDGYAGRVLITSDGYGSYPVTQINEPSETVFSRNPNLDELF